ncbi:MAG: hypothetical protein U1C74_25590 [Phenylobacterium sp.]|nr:hypothetical protein [Phenylobacterium sp.]
MDLLDLDDVKTHLADVAPTLRSIGFAADFAAAMGGGAVIASPTAFLIQTGEQPFEVREGSGPLRQLILVTISVLVAVNLAGRHGAAGLTALKAPVGEVRMGLFGWPHPDAEGKFLLAGGGIEDFDAKTGVLLYRLDFEAPVRIQETLT